MSVSQLAPYVNFNGEAQKAINLYEKVLGAKVEVLMRYGEMPGMNVSEEHKDRILHSMLRIGQAVLMISDAPPESKVSRGDNGRLGIQLAIQFDSEADLTRAFNALAEGGKVTQPLVDAFWGGKFGMVSDVLGVDWMFTQTPKKV